MAAFLPFLVQIPHHAIGRAHILLVLGSFSCGLLLLVVLLEGPPFPTI